MPQYTSPLIETGDPLDVRDLITAHAFACPDHGLYQTAHDHSQGQEFWDRISCWRCCSDIVAAPASVMTAAENLEACE